MTNRFSERTMSILLASGWHEGRAVSIDEIETEMAARYGLTPSPAARQFLKEFSGICLNVPYGDQLACRARFDPFPGARGAEYALLDPLRYTALCRLLKGSVYPIGTDDDFGCILMRTDGAVFSVAMPYDWLSFFGSSGDEAVEEACAPVRSVNGIALDDDMNVMQAEGYDFEKVRSQW